jgi:hypothetical protein
MLPTAAFAAAALVTFPAADASAVFTLIRAYDGPVAGGSFGYSCVVIGDMDGDGIAEFAIGAPDDATGGAGAGRVFIYRGGNPLPSDPAWVITGAPGEHMGRSLAWGYVDEDFVPDLVIGAPGSGAMTGRVVVAYGGSPLGARTPASVAGTTSGGRFGWAVAGFYFPHPSLRVLVGAPEANASAGEVHGLGTPPTTRLLVLHGEEAGEQFGFALSDAGITRGAIGGPEFLVGAPGSTVNGPGSGRAALYFYDTPNDTLADAEVTGASGARLGESIAGGVDINSNYFEPSDDVVIGAPGADPDGLAGAGSSFVYVNQPPFSYDGAVSHAGFGSTVRLTRDIAGTSAPDLAVGESNAVRVYTGPLYAGVPPVASLQGEAAGDEFGRSISNSGPIDAGYTTRYQFLIGAPQHGGAGRVYVYTDLSTPTGVPGGNPTVVAFAAPAPNPSRDAFALTVDLPRATHARIAVFDVTGRRVATLHDGPLGPGRFPFRWTPRGADAAGLYWGVLEADGERIARRMARVP